MIKIEQLINAAKNGQNINFDYSFFHKKLNQEVTPLICAMLQNNRKLFCELISLGANINFTNDKVLAPLTYVNCNEFFIKELIKNKNINFNQDFGISGKNIFEFFLIKLHHHVFVKKEIKNISTILNEINKQDVKNKELFYRYHLPSNLIFQKDFCKMILKKLPKKIFKEKIDNTSYLTILIKNYYEDESMFKYIMENIDFDKINIKGGLLNLLMMDKTWISIGDCEIAIKFLEYGINTNILSNDNINYHNLFMEKSEKYNNKYKEILITENYNKINKKLNSDIKKEKIIKNKI